MIQSTVWDLDPHTEAKHEILRKYLDAWLPKITRYNNRVIICDGFAGPGRYSNGENGSPVIAIEAFSEHSYRMKMNAKVMYIFIEADPERFSSLQSIIGEMDLPKSVDATFINEEYEVAFGQILDYMDQREYSLAPTFAFIDPFGIKGVPLNIIERLMQHPSCEVFITFMLSALQRFVTRPEFEAHSDRLFGCEDWRRAKDLVGHEREVFFRELYQRQLETVVSAKYVRFFTMKNERNRTIYDLFFATNHEKGIDAMKDSMWKVDQTGAFSFSDATDPEQETLFSNDPDWDQLFQILQSQFGGQTKTWAEVEEAIRRSPFRILKRPLQAESKKPNSRFEIVNPAGVRTGTLNETTRIRFPALSSQ